MPPIIPAPVTALIVPPVATPVPFTAPPIPTVAPIITELPIPVPQKPTETPYVPKIKAEFNQKYGRIIIMWTKENRNPLVLGRINYRWKDKNLSQSLDKRNELQKQLVLSRIRNVGGVDRAVLDAIMTWGFPNPVFPERDEQKCLSVTRDAFNLLDQGRVSDAILKLMSLEGVGISRASKVIGLLIKTTLPFLMAELVLH